MELKNNQWPLTLHLAALGLKLGCVMLDKQRNFTTFCCESLLWPRRIIWMCLKSREAQGQVRETSKEWGSGKLCFFFFFSFFWSRSVLTTLFVTFPSAVSSFINVFFLLPNVSVQGYLVYYWLYFNAGGCNLDGWSCFLFLWCCQYLTLEHCRGA